jgi:sugar phosphate permease
MKRTRTDGLIDGTEMNDTKRQVPRRIRRLQTISLALLVVCGTINYLDRGALSVANPAIRADLGVSISEMGLLLSAFAWSYALVQLPVGGLVDRAGPRLLLGIGMTLWSLAQAVGGLVTSFSQFIWARIFLGIGEAPQYPTSARVVSNWFAVRDRGMPTGVFNAASPLGTALAPPLLTLLMLSFSWRWMFVAMGVVGLIGAAIWVLIYRDPDAVGLSSEEHAYIERGAAKGAAAKTTFAEWRSLFAYRTTWGMILGFFGSVYLNWVFLTWLPGYLEIERHMSTFGTGFAAAIPFFCGFVGCLVAGWFSDVLARRGTSPVRSRKVPVIVAMVGMALFTVPAALVASNVVALACISVVVFLANAASACSWALATVAAPPNRVASLGALQNFGGFLGGALAPIVTGAIAQATHSFIPALLAGAAIAFVSAMIYLFVVRDPIPHQAGAAVERVVP